MSPAVRLRGCHGAIAPWVGAVCHRAMSDLAVEVGRARRDSSKRAGAALSRCAHRGGSAVTVPVRRAHGPEVVRASFHVPARSSRAAALQICLAGAAGFVTMRGGEEMKIESEWAADPERKLRAARKEYSCSQVSVEQSGRAPGAPAGLPCSVIASNSR